MEIAGVKKAKDDDRYTILKKDENGKSIRIDLAYRPVPLGFHEETEDLFPSPTPPVKGWARDQDKQFIRDPRTGALIREYDFDSKNYKEKVRRMNRVHNMRTIEYSWIEYDKKVTMKTVRDDFPDNTEGAIQYYLNLFQELKDWGFTDGDYVGFSECIVRLSNIGRVEIEEATEKDFLSEEDLGNELKKQES